MTRKQPKRAKWSQKTIKDAIFYCDLAASEASFLTPKQSEGFFSLFSEKAQELAGAAANNAPVPTFMSLPSFVNPEDWRILFAEAAQVLREGWLPDED